MFMLSFASAELESQQTTKPRKEKKKINNDKRGKYEKIIKRQNWVPPAKNTKTTKNKMLNNDAS